MKKIPYFREMDDAEVDAASSEELRRAYRELREHHISETTALWERLGEARRRAIGSEGWIERELDRSS